MSIRIKLATAAAIIGALSITPAFAEILNFSWDYTPGIVATWSQPSNPTPLLFDDLSTLVEVSGTNNLGRPFKGVWYDNIEIGNGGLQIPALGGAYAIGYPIFSGSEATPIFSPGRYRVGDRADEFVIVTAAPPGSRTVNLGDDADWLCGPRLRGGAAQGRRSHRLCMTEGGLAYRTGRAWRTSECQANSPMTMRRTIWRSFPPCALGVITAPSAQATYVVRSEQLGRGAFRGTASLLSSH